MNFPLWGVSPSTQEVSPSVLAFEIGVYERKESQLANVFDNFLNSYFARELAKLRDLES